ncbi:neuropeptide prohormone-4 [Aplysia californica]|uniref:Neuropeptide prohormone-4 n=1 Tax=Aplysia californica TaxID=6500 RepID=A0ABM1VZC2_APLCA|nr:neuropeptide prohormone-4 [Aplysia californica]
MTLCARLEIVTFTLVAVVLACTYGLKIDLSRLAFQRPSLFSKRTDSGCYGNPCEASKPFLCRDSPKCVALKYVCDGTWDCEGGFDEDPAVCNAASRPSFDDLLFFVQNQRKWMIPELFNGADPELVAHALSVANDMQDLSDQVGMTQENVDRLHKAFEAAVEGDERPLLDMGMSERSWHEVQYVLQQLLDSGFKL